MQQVSLNTLLAKLEVYFQIFTANLLEWMMILHMEDKEVALKRKIQSYPHLKKLKTSSNENSVATTQITLMKSLTKETVSIQPSNFIGDKSQTHLAKKTLMRKWLPW